MTTNRTRREDPARTEPFRQWEQLLKNGKRADAANGDAMDGHAWQAQHANGHASSAGPNPIDKTITDAVKLGYKIVEEQIEQGKRVAAELSGRSYSTNSVASDTSDFVKRLLRFYTDIGATCFEFIETLSRNVPSSPARTGEPFTAQGATPDTRHDGSAAASPGRSVAIEVAADVPTRVSVNLTEAIDGRALGVHALSALDADAPPLSEVAFTYDESSAAPTLQVRVPKGQPEGSYVGVVVDLVTNEPCGTLSIQIGSR